MADHAARKEKSIFLRAVEIESETERAKYVDEACGDDRALLAEVEALLRAYQKPCGVLEAPDAVAPTAPMPRLTERPGTTIGPYKLMEQVGEGGMGVVFVAEQQEPVRRKVALKIIKPGMDTKEVIARFEAERQALALMDHPNIARVLDAGTTDSGLPYFVMELVRGIPINDYCDKNNLTTGERLELFLPVCHAIQHAHQKGIIHRDVKPSNVMVTLHDGVAVPKIIDFGVAKATSQRLTERTVYTRYAQMVGTPLYMSPEQAEMSGLDIDTRSDVYSLGVLLYELLTGTTPFDKKRLREAAYDELLRIIREEEPPKPSTRISSLGDTAVTVSAHRKIEPRRLGQLLRGDLDWIVMKALEKDRGRRYETANGFAADIKRYLDDQPVLACPPSAIYRFRKFSRRNKAAMTTVGLVTAVLVLGVIVSSWMAVRAVVAERVARQGEQRAVDAERIANRQRDLAQEAGLQAEEQRDENRRLLYPADMIRAQQAWDAGDVAGTLEILQRHVPREGETDSPGFHWRCLRRLCDRSLARKPMRYPERVCSVALSPDGRLVAAAGYLGTVYVWDVATGDRVDPGLAGWAVACSPNETTFAIRDGTSISLWNPDTGPQKDVMPYSGGSTFNLAYSSDGSRLATGGFDRKVYVWDLAKGGAPRVFGGAEFVIFSVALSPDGRWVAAATAPQLLIWNVEGDGEPIVLEQYLDNACCVAFSHDGTTIVSGGWDGRIQFWDVETRRRKRVLRTKNGVLTRSLACSPDGRLAAGAEDGSVTIWSLDDGEQIDVLKGHQHTVWSVDFSRDNRTLASASMDGEVRIWDVANRRPPDALKHPTQEFNCIAFSPDGSVVATVSTDLIVRLWDVRTGEELETLPAHRSGAGKVAISPSGDCLASVSLDGTVRVWDLARGMERFLLKQFLPCSVTFSPNGETMAVGGCMGQLQLWDPKTGTRGLECKGHEKLVGALAISPDGKILASGGWDSTIILWEVSTGRCLGTLPGHSRDVTCLAFSPDRKTLASCAGDGTVKLWDVLARKELDTLLGHGATVFSLAFSPDGRILASGGGDSTIKLWYLGTNRKPESLPADAPVRSVAFSPSGDTLASVSGDTVRFWRTVAVEGSDELDRLWDLQRRVRTIADQGPQEQHQILGDLSRHLAASASKGLLLRRDIVLATSTAWRLENGGHDQLAEEAFRRFGEAIGGSKDPRFSTLASDWEAALSEHRARLCVEAGQYNEAIAHFTKAVANRPDNRELRVTRGQICVFQSRWKEAAADFTRAIELDPSDIMTWLRTAPLLVLAGDLEGYRKHCKAMVLQFAESEQVRDASITCKACLLLPDAVDASMLPLELLENALDDGSSPSWHYKWGYAHRALAVLRAGDADAAVRWIGRSQESPGYATAHPLRALSLSLLAMAQHQLGNPQEAREALVQADELIEEYLPRLASGGLSGWHDWLIAQILHREARVMISGGPVYEHLKKANELVEAGELSRAAEELSQAIALDPEDSFLHLKRGRLHVRLTQWKEAAADYRKLVELEPDDVSTWLHAAPLLVLADDPASYREHCQEMLARFGASAEAHIAEKTSKACLLLAGDLEALKTPLDTLENALENGSAPSYLNRYGYATLALAAHRAGDADRAIEWSRKAQGSLRYSESPTVKAIVLCVLAMSQYQSGERTEASETLVKANTVIDEHLARLSSGEVSNMWHDWLIADILRREAAELIEGPKASTPDMKAEPNSESK